MKITVEIDFNDMFSDNEKMTFSEIIKNHIIDDAKYQMLALWQEQTKKDVHNTIRKELDEQKEKIIEETVKNVFEEGNVNAGYSGIKISYKEYIEKKISDSVTDASRTRGSVNDFIDKVTAEMIDKLKENYDTMFATQIIKKLYDNNLLKEDIFNLLIDKQS